MIVYVDGFKPQVLAYAAGERPILYVSPAYDRKEYARLRAAFPARWLLAPLDSPAIGGLRANASAPVGSLEATGVRWGLYHLPE